MITHCTQCGGWIVRGDDIVRDMANRGFRHRDCDEYARQQAIDRLIKKISKPIAAPGSEGLKPSNE